MMIAWVVMLGVVLVSAVIAVTVVPRFDRPSPLLAPAPGAGPGVVG